MQGGGVCVCTTFGIPQDNVASIILIMRPRGAFPLGGTVLDWAAPARAGGRGATRA